MDRFLIKNPGKGKTPEEQPPTKKTKIDYDRKYDQNKRKRVFQSSWLAEFRWLRVYEDGTATCKVCREFPLLADQKGAFYIGTTVTRKDSIISHDKSTKHASCILKHEREELKKTNKPFSGDLEKTLKKYNQGQTDRFKMLFNTAYAVAKNRKPYSDFEIMCEIQQKNGLDLGNDHLNRKACIEFVKAIAESLQSDIKDKLSRSRFYSVMSDSSTDSAIIDQECIMVRFLDPDTKTPITTIASIEALETPDANGVFSSIKEGLKMIDIDLESCEVGGPSLVCVNMDGASVNMGAKNGVAKKISDCVQHPVLITHCVAHRLELGILDAAKQVSYLEEFEGVIKRIYKFYSFSPKRRSHLSTVSDVLDKDLIMYSDIKSIRWVSSKRRAVLAVATDYEATVTHLEQILETSKKTDEKAQAKKILTDITRVKFVKYLHLMMDVLKNVSAASQMFQVKDLLMFEVQEVVDTLYTQIHAMTVSPGESLKTFYDNFDKTTRLYNNIKLCGPIPLPFEDDNDIQKFLTDVGSNVLNRFKNLSDPPLVHFRAFDFRLWPKSLNEIALHGNEAVGQLCETYSDLLTDDEKHRIPDEWQQLKVRMSMQHGGHPLAVYSQILESGEKEFVNISKLIELFFVFSPSTAECERAFSSMNLIKTPTRSKLNQANLLNQMRIVTCGPSTKDFDPAQSVQHWLNNCVGSGSRHLTHKPKTKSVASTSTTQAQQSSEQPNNQLFCEVMDKIGDSETRDKLKNAMASDQCSLQ